MKIALCVTIGIVIEVPDDGMPIGAPVANSPLEELAARLRREARCGRDSIDSGFAVPDVAAWMAAAYQEFAQRN